MIRLLILVPLAIVAVAPVASAQVGGSYQDSCDNIRQRGPFLSAECQTMDGDVRRSSLDVRGCSGGVSNADGRLTCGRRSARGAYGGDYGGDYRPLGNPLQFGYRPYRRDRSYGASDYDE